MLLAGLLILAAQNMSAPPAHAMPINGDLFGVGASAAAACGLAHLDACGGMYALVERPDFKRALRRFVGPGTATWLTPNEDKAEAILDFLQGPSGDPDTLADGLIRFEACYPHICTQRAAVFFTPAGEIKAVALLFNDCGGKTCRGDENLTLAILLREDSLALMTDAKNWASQSVADSNREFGAFSHEQIEFTQVWINRD